MRFLWVLLFAALPGVAHDLYLMPERFQVEAGRELLIRLENGDEFPEGSAPVKRERIRQARLISRVGEVDFHEIVVGDRRTTARVRIPGAGTAILVVETKANFIELDPATFRSYLEHENLNEVLEWRERNGESDRPGRELYSKYAKSLIHGGQPDAFHREPAGLTIEIIPESDPYKLRPGDSLPVRLLFRGAPAKNVAIEAAWLEQGSARIVTAGRTDSEGRLHVPIRATGPHRLHTIVMERCLDRSRADWESFWASLTFEVPSDR